MGLSFPYDPDLDKPKAKYATYGLLSFFWLANMIACYLIDNNNLKGDNPESETNVESGIGSCNNINISLNINGSVIYYIVAGLFWLSIMITLIVRDNKAYCKKFIYDDNHKSKQMAAGGIYTFIFLLFPLYFLALFLKGKIGMIEGIIFILMFIILFILSFTRDYSDAFAYCDNKFVRTPGPNSYRATVGYYTMILIVYSIMIVATPFLVVKTNKFVGMGLHTVITIITLALCMIRDFAKIDTIPTTDKPKVSSPVVVPATS